ncbi:LLM class flavin-dependent oxidoreductase [Pseudonocardia acaciae]|uniref:LLM class flavin-dependent oxidoreductase n=1 Tax=Pseudonocardia acaciae TaxID=551276 RepID=UPI00048C126D|nr:LLM class flavin-dependent oxidoreductase [Pseudonocardia acaciae]
MTIRLGAQLPVNASRGDGVIPDIAVAARHAEDVGLDAVWAGDHLTTGTPMLDSTVALSVAASATERINIGYAVMLLALRQPAWAAKQIGSLQYVSGNAQYDLIAQARALLVG